MTETPSRAAPESPATEVEEIAADRRREWLLIPQAIIAAGVVVAIVIVRELLLR